MRSLLALVGAATITFVGLGWYLGWYKLTRQPAAPGTQRFSVDLHPDKVTTDTKIAIERTGEIITRLGENNGDSTEKHAQAQPGVPSPPSKGQAPVENSPNQGFTPPGTIQPVGATSPR